ncbi:hypothetical protein Rhal01_00599 [Rubritalea halochordaticola]|uniref:Lipoprotein n=2 Tax=Rubritalea halochordaticola TaxID=714537 RepID=A0ABP9UVF4_9BACT
MKPIMLLPILASSLLTSCVYDTADSYVAPTKPIPGSKAHGYSEKTLRPQAKFPVRIAVARVQTRGSQIHLIEDRDFEREEHQQVISSLPQIRGMVNVDPGQLESTDTSYPELRKAARRLGCNMLAVYRFHASHQSKNASTLLSVATLGAAPTNSHTTNATVSLTLIDASTGYIYGVSEETARTKSLSTSWGNGDSKESAKQRAQQKAYDQLIENLPRFWNSVLKKS